MLPFYISILLILATFPGVVHGYHVVGDAVPGKNRLQIGQHIYWGGFADLLLSAFILGGLLLSIFATSGTDSRYSYPDEMVYPTALFGFGISYGVVVLIANSGQNDQAKLANPSSIAKIKRSYTLYNFHSAAVFLSAAFILTQLSWWLFVESSLLREMTNKFIHQAYNMKSIINTLPSERRALELATLEGEYLHLSLRSSAILDPIVLLIGYGVFLHLALRWSPLNGSFCDSGYKITTWLTALLSMAFLFGATWVYFDYLGKLHSTMSDLIESAYPMGMNDLQSQRYLVSLKSSLADSHGIRGFLKSFLAQGVVISVAASLQWVVEFRQLTFGKAS